MAGWQGWKDDRSRGNKDDKWSGWYQDDADRSRGREDDKRSGWYQDDADRSRGREDDKRSGWYQDDAGIWSRGDCLTEAEAKAKEKATAKDCPSTDEVPSLDQQVPAAAPAAQALPPEDRTAVAVSITEQEHYRLLDGPTVYDLNYFADWANGTRWNDTYKQHSVALKYFREVGERTNVQEVVFNNHEAEAVGVIVHEKGEAFHFEPFLGAVPWRWQEMVAQMNEDSMRMVLQGLQDPPDDRSRGLVSCRLQKTGRYDHKRHHALKKINQAPEEMLKIWDFVLVCKDGTLVCLHPNFSNTKIDCYTGVAEEDDELPRSGRGGTSGPGTYKYFKNKTIACTLRFDANKKPDKGKGVGKAVKDFLKGTGKGGFLAGKAAVADPAVSSTGASGSTGMGN
jgi:hypothetical protein